VVQEINSLESLTDELLSSPYGSDQALDLVEQIEDRFGPTAADEAVEKFYEHCFGGTHDLHDYPLNVRRERTKRNRWIGKRVLQGGCQHCGRTLPLEYQFDTCPICLRKKSEYHKRSRVIVRCRYRSKHSNTESIQMTEELA
jgi:rubrerythrin